jgi:hypothetical protein
MKLSQADRDTDGNSIDSCASVVPYDEMLLECARTQWQFGDWASLSKLNQESIQHHPQRAKLALLAAAGRFQLGENNAAHHYIRLAQDWGCSPRLAKQILVSGTHNTLGVATALLGNTQRSSAHFRSALKLGGIPGDIELLVSVRSSRQLGGIPNNEQVKQ